MGEAAVTQSCPDAFKQTGAFQDFLGQRGVRTILAANQRQPLARMLWLSAVFMLMTFVVFIGYGTLASSIRDHVISRPRVLTWLRRTFAGAFVALGARLALTNP